MQLSQVNSCLATEAMASLKRAGTILVIIDLVITHRVGKADTNAQHDAANNEHAKTTVPRDCACREASSNEIADAGNDHADLSTLNLCHIACNQGGKESWTAE